ncbi:MAG: hypothetical protein WBB65_13565 [Anaerolineales bacterium]
MSESFDPDQSNPEGINSQRKFLRALVIFIVVALIIVIALGVYTVIQTRDLWLDTQPKTLDPADVQATSTAACETFITEFPGTPCP